MSLITLTLNKHAERRLDLKHPWIFSNEIEGVNLKALPPGSLVRVLDRRGQFVGTGFVNAHSLIAVRLLSRDAKEVVDEIFFCRVFRQSIARRQPFYGEKTSARGTYRAVFGESDGLPGLIVDRYGPVWVMEYHALGMAVREDLLRQALKQAVHQELGADHWQALVVRSDVRVAQLEGLQVRQEALEGAVPEKVYAYEAQLAIPVDVLSGQKTGFFFDQRENRRQFASAVRGISNAKVIDVFCHLGAWGLLALQAGAEQVCFVDQSEVVVRQIEKVVAENGWQGKARYHVGDALEFMRSEQNESWNAIALDPPAFISSKKSIPQGLRAYYVNNREAVRILKPGGLLSTSTCSFHCDEVSFKETVMRAALDRGRVPRILQRGNPAFDHPALANMAETIYLKNYLLQL